jgi:hypothetical protein
MGFLVMSLLVTIPPPFLKVVLTFVRVEGCESLLRISIKARLSNACALRQRVRRERVATLLRRDQVCAGA